MIHTVCQETRQKASLFQSIGNDNHPVFIAFPFPPRFRSHPRLRRITCTPVTVAFASSNVNRFALPKVHAVDHLRVENAARTHRSAGGGLARCLAWPAIITALLSKNRD